MVNLLSQILGEKKATDVKLTKVIEPSIMPEALESEEEKTPVEARETAVAPKRFDDSSSRFRQLKGVVSTCERPRLSNRNDRYQLTVVNCLEIVQLRQEP